MHNLGQNTDQIRRWQSPMALSGSKRIAIREALVADRAARQASPDFPRIHENSHVRDDTKESSLESIEHSVGCPKYKCSSKSKCQLRSPTRAPKVLHPKPWGARDPKEIPCTCFTRRKFQRSAPASIRTSPTRELRKSIPRRNQSPRSHFYKEDTIDDVGEVMKKFDEFFDHAERTGVKFSPSTLEDMYNKMKNKLCNTTLNATAKTKAQVGRMGKRRTSSLDSAKQVQDVVGLKILPEVPQDQRSQSNQSHQPSMSSSTVRGKLEANNVVLELSGSDFPDQTAAFTNIFGSMLPTERFNYVALGGNQFFGPGEVLSPGIPTATIVIDSTDGYMPMNDVVVPARLPRSPHRSLRRKHL